MIEVVRHGMATTVFALAETVELDLCLMVGNRSILGASESVALLLDRVDQSEGVPGRLKEIEVGLFLYLPLEVIIIEPEDSGDHLAQDGGVASLLGHHILASVLPPVLGAVQIVSHIFVAWIGHNIEDVWLMIPYSRTHVMAILEVFVYQQIICGLLELVQSEGTERCSVQVLRQGRHRKPVVALLEACLYYIYLLVRAWIDLDLGS